MNFAGRTYTGKGIKLAIIDTGIQMDSKQVLGSWDVFLSNTGKIINKLRQSDLIGRGTQLAQLVFELAPEVELIGINIFNEQAKTNSDILAAGLALALEKNVDIICLCVNTSNPEKRTKFEQLEQRCKEKDIVVVVANSQPDVLTYPTAFASSIAISTHRLIDSSMDSRIFYCDPKYFPKHRVEKSGSFLLSAHREKHFRGVEFATARAAAYLACLKEARPELFAGELKELLTQKALLPLGAAEKYILDPET